MRKCARIVIYDLLILNGTMKSLEMIYAWPHIFWSVNVFVTRWLSIEIRVTGLGEVTTYLGMYAIPSWNADYVASNSM